jgi:formyltetrahydrofolate synthetase
MTAPLKIEAIAESMGLVPAVYENVRSVVEGAADLEAHLSIIRRFGVPAVPAINRFPEDTADRSEKSYVSDISFLALRGDPGRFS